MVLLAVYRSVLLALVPLSTIGVGLLISRGVLAWMTVVGWDMSPLVELFLVVILFGCGTDFCLLVSWRFGENWNRANPAGAMRTTLKLVSPRPADQRRDGHRRAVADGPDPVQAVLVDRPERRARAGDHAGRHPVADAGLAAVCWRGTDRRRSPG